jgi:uncharacterized protein YegP (UPF0339 family)
MESSAKSIRIAKGDDSDWYFTPLGGNGEPLAQSEGYTERNDAIEAASALLPGVEIDVVG